MCNHCLHILTDKYRLTKEKTTQTLWLILAQVEKEETTMSASSHSEKKRWWLTDRKIAEKYVKEARVLVASPERSDVVCALNLLDAALSLCPRLERALELKARSLLYLRRFKDVADMLQNYIPSVNASDDSSSDNSSSHLSRERLKLLSSDNSPNVDGTCTTFKCFSDLRKNVLAGLCNNLEKEGQYWRYLVLGQACCHLGLMEDAMTLLQIGKRLATEALRRESTSCLEDSFSFAKFPISKEITNTTRNQQPPTPLKTEFDYVSQLLGQIKFLIRRKTAATAALDAGLYSEAIRHFSKIIEGRRGPPQGFLAECYMHRAAAYRSAGRIADAIADCNRALSLEPSFIEALTTRAALFETIRCLHNCLHDLEHLKLLYNSILRDRKLPGPAWKCQNVHYREIPEKLCSLAAKIQELKRRVASGETVNVDFYALIGLGRTCTRSELERAHVLLTLRHKPDKAMSFIERCEFADQEHEDPVRDRARMSALMLFRLIQKGYTNLMTIILDEEVVEKQSKKAAAALQATQIQHSEEQSKFEAQLDAVPNKSSANSATSATASVIQGVFCREIAIVGNLLSQAGFNHQLPVKYEALSC